LLRDIRACVEHEPATAPWYAVRHSPTRFAIFEAFPDIAGRDAPVAGGGGDIFRDIERMNAILARPARVQKDRPASDPAHERGPESRALPSQIRDG
jgi:hypothetical protein